MRKPVTITTPPVTPEEVAQILRVPPKRAAELFKLADEMWTRTRRREKASSRKRARSKQHSRH
jgi:hypothetical protein